MNYAKTKISQVPNPEPSEMMASNSMRRVTPYEREIAQPLPLTSNATEDEMQSPLNPVLDLPDMVYMRSLSIFDCPL